MKDISNIKINFDNNNELENIPFCHKVVNMINLEKKNNLEKYIIFSSKIQMNLLTKTNQILIDGTFKSCPRGYYQIINIAGYYPDIDSIIPIFMIPSTGKTFFLYNSIFEDVKKILIDNGIDINKIPKRIMIDFEKGLQKAVKKNFPDSIIDGCYFHYVKLLWGKAKKFGMCKKNDLPITKILLFILKILPFLRVDDKAKVFDKLEELFLNHENKYKKMIAYYKKNWIHNNYINYTEISKEEFINRTNNYLESFHGQMNQLLQCYHPKLSYLIEKYKNYLKNIYEKIKVNLVSNSVQPNIKKFSIIEDIFNYLKNYNEKYDSNININLIIQSNEKEKEVIYKIL